MNHCSGRLPSSSSRSSKPSFPVSVLFKGSFFPHCNLHTHAVFPLWSSGGIAWPLDRFATFVTGRYFGLFGVGRPTMSQYAPGICHLVSQVTSPICIFRHADQFKTRIQLSTPVLCILSVLLFPPAPKYPDPLCGTKKALLQPL